MCVGPVFRTRFDPPALPRSGELRASWKEGRLEGGQGQDWVGRGRSGRVSSLGFSVFETGGSPVLRCFRLLLRTCFVFVLGWRWFCVPTEGGTTPRLTGAQSRRQCRRTETFGVFSSCSNEAFAPDDFRAHFFRFPLHSSWFGDGHIVHGTAPSAPT